MRPYLAIIKDSFREALASRVLYIVLILITLLLLIVAPLTYRQELTTGLRGGEIDQWPELIEKLKEGERDSKPTPARRMWSLLTPEDQKLIKDFKRLKKQPQLKDVNEFTSSIREVSKSLDKLVKRTDLYDKESFRSVTLSFEGRRLVSGGVEKLDEQDVKRLNRILFEASFPGLVAVSPSTSMQLRYSLFGDFLPPLPLTKGDFRAALARAMPLVIDKGLLAIGLLIAILVTAPIIPQTFDPGSLHLLLSKPIGRSLLFLTKFAGGCAFVFVCASYLFGGLWLILGARFGIWEARIFYCVPLYVFVFAVYYSVAALAGLYWRNTIVSIVIVIVFWGLCFVLGVGKDRTEGLVNKYRITRIIPAKDDLMAVDQDHTPLAWDADAKDWKSVFVTDEAAQFKFFMSLANLPQMDPVYDQKNDQLVGVILSFSNGQQMVAGGTRKNNWKPVEGPPAPIAPRMMLVEPDGTPLLVTNFGFHRFTGEIKPQTDPVKFLGYTLPGFNRGAVTEAGPTPAQSWSSEMSAAMDPKSGLLAVYNVGELITFTKGSGNRYQEEKKRKVVEKEKFPATIAIGGGVILVARKANGEVLLCDAKSLEQKQAMTLEMESRPIGAAASPDGKTFALWFENNRLWLIDSTSGQAEVADVSGQRDISAAAFRASGTLVVADRTRRLTEYDLADMSVKNRLTPPMTISERAYRYVLRPTYAICPKPGEFYKTVQYLLADSAQKAARKSEDEGVVVEALESNPLDNHPWSPVWSSAIFMAVMLALGCVYMHWQEF
jgi:ABC-type transport system involved in multi-copper enzyme maturation permease subunit